jgi:hypothetical protein
MKTPLACEHEMVYSMNVYAHLNQELKGKWNKVLSEFKDGIITEKVCCNKISIKCLKNPLRQVVLIISNYEKALEWDLIEKMEESNLAFKFER